MPSFTRLASLVSMAMMASTVSSAPLGQRDVDVNAPVNVECDLDNNVVHVLKRQLGGLDATSVIPEVTGILGMGKRYSK